MSEESRAVLSVCGLCGHAMTLERCGYAAVTTDGRGVYLCHADDHDCYHAWTLYGTRPDTPWPRFGCKDDPREDSTPILDRMVLSPDVLERVMKQFDR